MLRGLEPGDLLAMCTDGVLGRHNPRGEEFTVERICSIVDGRPRAAAQDTAEQIVAAAVKFGGDGHEDDATILIVTRLAADDGGP